MYLKCGGETERNRFVRVAWLRRLFLFKSLVAINFCSIGKVVKAELDLNNLAF